jgi:hypothetical protein
MSRIYVTLATAAASALATAAVVALPALGEDPGGKPAGNNVDEQIAGLVTCLRAHGLDAPSAIDEFKPWLAGQETSNPRATEAAERACKAQAPKVERGAVPEEFMACVRAHGVDAPAAPAAFERWMRSNKATDEDALETVLRECKLALGPPKSDEAAKPGDCAAGAPGPKAAEPRQSTDSSSPTL